MRVAIILLMLFVSACDVAYDDGNGKAISGEEKREFIKKIRKEFSDLKNEIKIKYCEQRGTLGEVYARERQEGVPIGDQMSLLDKLGHIEEVDEYRALVNDAYQIPIASDEVDKYRLISEFGIKKTYECLKKEFG